MGKRLFCLRRGGSHRVSLRQLIPVYYSSSWSHALLLYITSPHPPPHRRLVAAASAPPPPRSAQHGSTRAVQAVRGRGGHRVSLRQLAPVYLSSSWPPVLLTESFTRQHASRRTPSTPPHTLLPADHHTTQAPTSPAATAACSLTAVLPIHAFSPPPPLRPSHPLPPPILCCPLCCPRSSK